MTDQIVLPNYSLSFLWKTHVGCSWLDMDQKLIAWFLIGVFESLIDCISQFKQYLGETLCLFSFLLTPINCLQSGCGAVNWQRNTGAKRSWCFFFFTESLFFLTWILLCSNNKERNSISHPKRMNFLPYLDLGKEHLQAKCPLAR